MHNQWHKYKKTQVKKLSIGNFIQFCGWAMCNLATVFEGKLFFCTNIVYYLLNIQAAVSLPVVPREQKGSRFVFLMHLPPSLKCLNYSTLLRLSSAVRGGIQYSLWIRGNCLQGTSLPHLIVISCYKISYTLQSVAHPVTKTPNQMLSGNQGQDLSWEYYKMDKNDMN